MLLERIPEWLGAALIGAAIAFIGFVGKTIVESMNASRALKDARRAELVELHSLLKASQAIFLTQAQQRDRLAELIERNHPDSARTSTGAEGYEALFSSTFKRLSPEERELHSIIRGMTIHAMLPTNTAMLDWLRKDSFYKAQPLDKGNYKALPTLLTQLEAHLLLWKAKYEAWIPDRPDHALVYLADEQHHGVGFPGGIDSVVTEILGFQK